MSPDKKLNVFTSVNYFNNRTKGRQDTGYGDNNIMVKFTQWGQRQLNMNELESLYKNPDGSQASWNIGGIDDTALISGLTSSMSAMPFTLRNCLSIRKSPVSSMS